MAASTTTMLGMLLSCLLSLSSCRGPSILDIINTEEVERLIAQRNTNVSRHPDRRNYLEPEEEEENNPSWDYYEPRSMYAVASRKNASIDSSKLLKSSKDALLVTKQDYLKKDWCKTEPLIQKIKDEGCVTRTVVNSFCYGQCNSFYIPRNPKRRQAFKSCSFCKPKKSTTLVVTLKCPGLNPPLRRKKVLRVMQCKCLTSN